MISIKNKIYSKAPVDFKISDIPLRAEPRNVLMATPEYFDIIDVKNAHMEGQAGRLDKKKAYAQWEFIKQQYLSLVKRKVLDGYYEIAGAKGCEDMVFAANQTFPWMNDQNEKIVIMSKMKHPSRQKEVSFFEKFFADLGYRIIHLKNTRLFEGMGDTIPHPGRKLLYGGFGHRSDKSAYEELAEILNVPIVCLELQDERFYHLDTCFVPLSEKAVMLHAAAFTEEGLQLIHSLFEEVIEIPADEAAGNFALNAHTINDKSNNDKVAIIQKGSFKTNEVLKKSGYEVIEADTSEYMKSGGSVFCMKMMVY